MVFVHLNEENGHVICIVMWNSSGMTVFLFEYNCITLHCHLILYQMCGLDVLSGQVK